MTIKATKISTLKTTTPEMTAETPGHYSSFNPYWQQMVDNDKFLDDKIEGLKQTTEQKEVNFAGSLGVTIPHNIGHTNYNVNLIPLQDPEGYLGEVWVSKAANAFTVFNSGSFTGLFRYQIHT